MTHTRLHRFPFGNVLEQLANEAFEQVIVPAVRGSHSKPAANILESETSYKVEIVAPGFTKADLKIALDKNVLTVSAKKETENNAATVNNLKHREFSIQSFERSFTLPEQVDQSAIEAKFENGILVLQLPKRAEMIVEPKTINIS
jgi:HSP20 family protein